MKRNEFIQRLVIKEYGTYNITNLIKYANDAADKLEACGVPFDDEPIVVDADFEETDDVLQKPLKEFYEEGKISCRTFNVLKAAGAQAFGDVVALRKVDVLSIRACGKKTLAEIADLLHEYGYDWAVD